MDTFSIMPICIRPHETHSLQSCVCDSNPPETRPTLYASPSAAPSRTHTSRLSCCSRVALLPGSVTRGVTCLERSLSRTTRLEAVTREILCNSPIESSDGSSHHNRPVHEHVVYQGNFYSYLLFVNTNLSIIFERRRFNTEFS